jgi:accessory gene regulator protein AgrB
VWCQAIIFGLSVCVGYKLELVTAELVYTWMHSYGIGASTQVKPINEH